MMLFNLLWADLRRLWVGTSILIILIAASTALNIAVNLEERALRLGSARAAAPFDLIIGAPGSETQLILSSVFLQPGLLPLLPAEHLHALEHQPQVAWAAPLAFGDFYRGMPIVGTSATMTAQAGQQPLAQGHAFQGGFEAVAGAKTGLRIGDRIEPLHGQVGEEGAHAHEKVAYAIVGLMPEQGNAWDQAILVPIETVWHIHHADENHQGDEADADEAEHGGEEHGGGLSAIVVKPKSVAAAYQLRAQYRSGATIAVFPAEILTRLYGLLGDVRQLMSSIAGATQLLVSLCVILVAVIHVNQRHRQIAALRALGAPRHALFGLTWVSLIVPVAVGIAAGVLLGYAAAVVISTQVTGKSGFALPVILTDKDWQNVAMWFVFATAATLFPAAMSYRHSPAQALREQ